MKKGIIALALIFGFGYTYSQDTTNMVLDKENTAQENVVPEDQYSLETDTSFQSDDQARLNEESFGEAQPDTGAYMESESETEINADTSFGADAEGVCPDTSMEGAFATPEDTMGTARVETETEYNVSMEEEDGTLENVVEAPFKFIGNVASETGEGVGHIVGAPIKGGAKAIKGIAKGTATVVSEVGEGVGHIVSAPFVGIAKLFGAGRDEVNEKDLENMDANVEVETEGEAKMDVDTDDASADMEGNFEENQEVSEPDTDLYIEGEPQPENRVNIESDVDTDYEYDYDSDM